MSDVMEKEPLVNHNRQPKPHESVMNILDQSGHLKQIWDRTKPEEIKVVEKTFDRLIKEGYAAFRVKKDGSQGEKITKFDPEAEQMIMAPNLRGG